MDVIIYILWGYLYDHLVSMRFFTLIMNKLFIMSSKKDAKHYTMY